MSRAVLVTAIALLAFGEAAAEAQFVVRGRVLQASDAEPVAGANVRIADLPGVATGDDGRFELRGVPAGIQRIVINALGYETKALALVIRSDTTIDIALNLQPIPLTPLDVRPRFVELRGRVTDAATDRPIYDADVLIREDHELTNVDGRFEMGRVPAGMPIVVEVRALGYLPEAVAVELAADSTLSFALELDPVGQRMIELEVAEIDGRSRKSPFGRRIVDRGEVMLRSVWTARELVKDRISPWRPIGCLIVNERFIQINPWEYLETFLAVEIERIEILTYFRAVTVRVYTRRFIERMIAGEVELRPLVPGSCF